MFEEGEIRGLHPFSERLGEGGGEAGLQGPFCVLWVPPDLPRKPSFGAALLPGIWTSGKGQQGAAGGGFH